MAFLPINATEMQKKGITKPDFVLITGDAYLDHPSIGIAVISRVLESNGFSVVILAQPDINDDNVFRQFGEPLYGFLISSGNIDSMVSHYTVAKKRRNFDYYTPNGVMGKRPDRALTVYSQKVRSLFPKSTIIIGGLEASLRRLTHYDYWQNTLKKSVLIDSKANLLVYGMADRVITEIAWALKSGLKIEDLIYIRNTCWLTKDSSILPADKVRLKSFASTLKNKNYFVENFKIINENNDYLNGKPLVEEYDELFLIQNPPDEPLTQEEIDSVYELPYEREVHPFFSAIGPVKALEEVKFSLVSSRGCFGNCNFCALAAHQGRTIQSRSKESLLREGTTITSLKDFKGYIHDLGGPTANFYQPACDKQLKQGLCRNKNCLGFKKCTNLNVSHTKYLEVLKALRSLAKVKKVFIRSGIRFDYLLADKDDEFFHELVQNHISGQLKVAPEHISNRVLAQMNKPAKEVYFKFSEKYTKLNQCYQKKQFLVPYFMSSHPGSTLEDAIELALYLKKINYHPEQVQDFYPTPFTASTCMFYTNINPFTNETVYVAKSPHEKAMQRALIQFRNPKNHKLVKEALLKAKRADLIGKGQNCLIKN